MHRPVQQTNRILFSGAWNSLLYLALVPSQWYIICYTLVSARNKRIWTCCLACAGFIMLLLLFSTCRIHIDFQHAVYLSIFNMPYTYPFSTCRKPIDFQHAVYLSIFNMPYTNLNMPYFQHAVWNSTCRLFIFGSKHAVLNKKIFNRGNI